MSSTHSIDIKLKIDEEDAAKELLDNITFASIDLSVEQPGAMELFVLDTTQSTTTESNSSASSERKLESGQKFSISFSPSRSKAPPSNSKNSADDEFLLMGKLTQVGSSPTGRSTTQRSYKGVDESYRLYQGNYNRTFQNSTYSDIVKKIVEEQQLKIGQIDPSGAPKDHIFQTGQSNAEFIRCMADWIGFEFFMRNSKIYFRQPSEDDIVPLKWGENIRSYSVNTSIEGQVSKVIVVSHDEVNNETITAEAPKATQSSESKAPPNPSKKSQKEAVSDPTSNTEDPVLRVQVPNGWTQDEVQKFADVLWEDLGKQLITATARCEGNPEILPGISVEIQNDTGDNDELNGKYYVTMASHDYSDGEYLTEFSVSNSRYQSYISSNTSGGGSGFGSTGSSDPRTKPSTKIGQTPMIGIVTDIEDPENLGRVKVKFPTFSDQDNSDWAKVISVGAGSSRGLHCLPEVDDEVLVTFANGDVGNPYVLGGLWNSKATPPTTTEETIQGGDVVVRTFQTPSGNMIQFVEEGGAEQQGIYIKTKNGNEIQLNDSTEELTISAGKAIILSAPDIKMKKTDGGSSTVEMENLKVDGTMIC